MNLKKERQGEFIILGEALLWSLFPVIVILSLNNLSPLISLAWSTFFAAIFFAIVITIKKKWGELRNKNALKYILLAGFILGVLYFSLFFVGLKYTSAGNASIIALSEILFFFLFFNVWYKEYIHTAHMYGAFLMFIGALVILSSNFDTFHLGDILILLAAAVSPLGNYFQRRARKSVSSESILFIRSLISFPVIFLMAYILGDEIIWISFNKTFACLIIIGFLLIGLSKILWIEGIHRINVAKAGALSSISPAFTLFFAWLLLNNIPTKFQLLSFIPMFFGVVLLSRNGSNKGSKKRKG